MKAPHRWLPATFAAVGILVLTGCGVSKEDHERAVSELNKTKSDLTQAKNKVADLEKSLSAAQAQLRAQPKVPPPAEKVESASKPEAVDTGMQDKLAAAQKEAADLRSKVASLTGENESLKGMLEKLKSEYAEIQKKLGAGAQVPSPQLPGGLPKRP